MIFYTDPLNAPSQRITGLDAANVPDIVEAFDMTSIMLWRNNREHDIASSVAHQKELARPWRPEKIFVVFELARTAIDDAKATSMIMKSNGLHALSFWRDMAKQGGNCDTPVNRKIACLAFERC